MAGNKHVGTEDYVGVGRILQLPPPKAWTEAARRLDLIDFEHGRDPLYPEAVSEYIWDPATGNLAEKRVYATAGKTLQLFRILYDWDAITGLLLTKTSYALTWMPELGTGDATGILRVHYTWDADGNLASKRAEYL